MGTLPFKNKSTILLHLSAWLLLCMMLFLLMPLSWNVVLPNQFWVRQGVFVLLLMVVFYLNVHVVVPKLLFKKDKVWMFLGIALGLTILVLTAVQMVETWLNLPELMHKAFRPDQPYVPRKKLHPIDMFMLLTVFLTLGISTSIAAVQKWQSDEALRRQLEEEKINSELSYLKAQINPHFFFNTLNNIYALTSIDSERARMALLKLSRMMRYVLYETAKNQTLLSREVEFIKDFITLMRLRVSEKVQIDLQIQEKFSDILIAPMLLLPFIENCFKHGISSQHTSKILISLTMEDGFLQLHTENKIFSSGKPNLEIQESGIGLANTKRRLSLIYENKHELKIDEANPENEYRVDLKIDLN